MFNTLVNLIGLTINDEKIVDFIGKNGFKYPKKPFISNRSTDTYYWLENKKLGVDLLFQIRTYMDNYPLVQGEKKGIFVPVLSKVRWYNNKSKTTFPQGLDFGLSFEDLKNKIGEPTLKSSDITPTWLNDDGSESFYRWKLPVGDNKDIIWGVEFWDDQEIRDFSLGLNTRQALFILYDELLYETFDKFLTQQEFYNTAYMMFLQWSIDNGLIKSDVRVTEWLQGLKRGYITTGDFDAEKAFVSAYINNLSGHDILYTKDVAYRFLQSDELKDNYFGAEATKELNKMVYNNDNYDMVKDILDKRFAEYKEHKFAKSKK